MKSCLVTPENGPRPAGPPDKCFYCGEPLGAEHRWECVRRERRVKVRYTFDIEVEMPESWNASEIEFQRNDGTWCADNALSDVKRYAQRTGIPCLCSVFRAKYTGEAEGKEA